MVIVNRIGFLIGTKCYSADVSQRIQRRLYHIIMFLTINIIGRRGNFLILNYFDRTPYRLYYIAK